VRFSEFCRFLRAIPLIAALALVLFAPSQGTALESGRYTESEKVGFAFHKLGKFPPKYEAWINEMERYQKARPAEKAELVHKERYRLESGFLNYIPDVDLTSISIEATIESSNYFQQSQVEGVTTDVTIRLVNLPENYFPFMIGGTWIAIVIKDFDLLNEKKFNAEEYKKFAQQLGLTAAYQLSQRVFIDLKLRPVSVDVTAPIMLDGIEMWLMLAEIGEMTVWSTAARDRQHLWSYNAPWYVSQNQKDLLLLYRD